MKEEADSGRYQVGVMKQFCAGCSEGLWDQPQRSITFVNRQDKEIRV